MRHLSLKLLAAATLAWAVAPPAHAGQVIVHFIDPAHYTDIGPFDTHSRDPMGELQRFLVALGTRELPRNQTLTVDFLDITLAGLSRNIPRREANIRVIRNGADAPYLTVRYRLEEDGRLLASGKQDLTDLDYLRRFPYPTIQGSFPYEKRLLADWFEANFVAHDKGNGHAAVTLPQQAH